MRTIFLLLAIAAAGLVHAQPPAISQNGIVNSASRIPSTLTGTAIARNSRFLIEGVRLGSNLKDARVILRHGKQMVILPLLRVEPSNIEAWMPLRAPAGSGSLTVETAQGTSKAMTVDVVENQLGLYSRSDLGWGPGAIDNIGKASTRTSNSPDSPARPDQVVEIAATGVSSARSIQMIVGGHAAKVSAIRRASAHGFDFIRFGVPPNAPQGCYVPVYASAPGLAPSNVVTMTIARHGSQCSLEGGLDALVRSGRRTGVAGVSRTVAVFGANQPAVTTDEAFAAFFTAQRSVYEKSRVLLTPPEGTCTAYTALYGSDLAEFTSFPKALGNLSEARGLDAGKRFTIAAEGKSRLMPHPPARQGTYWVQLGLDDPGSRRSLPLFLNGPESTVSGEGGADIGAFTRQAPTPAAFEWLNRDQLTTIHRAQGATIEWRGVPADTLVLILAVSFDQITTAGGVCYCAARAEAGRLHIPAEMMAHFPATRQMPGTPKSGVFVVALQQRAGTPPAIPGLDQLRLFSVFTQALRAVYD